MPVVGSTELRANLKRFRNDIKDKTTARAITAVMQVGMANAVRYAPIEYSTLVNSRNQGLLKNNGEWYGVAGFFVNYAFYLETNKDWKPRPPDKKAGNAWNPKARPGFLTYGFESPESRRQIERTLQAVYKV